MSGSTPAEAIADFQRLKARGGVADPPPATAPVPDPEAARQASERAAIRLLTPAGRQAEAERRAAAATQQAPQQPPRESLRLAHSQRAEAEQVSARLRQALERAQEHLGVVSENRDRAKQALDEIEAAHTARLLDELTNGAAGRAPELAGGAERVALADAEHAVEIASRAVDVIDTDLMAAQTRLATAEAKIMTAMCRVLLDIGKAAALEILEAADALDQRRADLDALSMTITSYERKMGGQRGGWPAAIHTALTPELRGQPRLPSRLATPAGTALITRWSEIAQKLLADPEAAVGDDRT